MTRLIHLNGPPGIGKSTIAALYADRHPGTLNLDIDSLHRLIGGWQDPELDTHRMLRPLALAMAGTHLAGGRDVGLPQYLGLVEEVSKFERVAADHQAELVELVLLDGKAESVARFDRRPDRTEWDRESRLVVARGGGASMLEAMYDRLLEIVEQRPSAVTIRSEVGAVEQTYAQVVEALTAVHPRP